LPALPAAGVPSIDGFAFAAAPTRATGAAVGAPRPPWSHRRWGPIAAKLAHAALDAAAAAA